MACDACPASSGTYVWRSTLNTIHSMCAITVGVDDIHCATPGRSKLLEPMWSQEVTEDHFGVKTAVSVVAEQCTHEGLSTFAPLFHSQNLGVCVRYVSSSWKARLQ